VKPCKEPVKMLNKKILFEYNKFRETKNEDLFCHAPFTSMNFEQNGDVSICCYNRSDTIGSYPDNSLIDMWYGHKADQIRAYLKKNRLPKGCNICQTEFINKNFGALYSIKYDYLADDIYYDNANRFMPMPKVMEFEISNVCNLECIMCEGYYSSSIRKNRDKLPPLNNPYDAQFVKQLEPFIPHLTEAKFLGGEPFLIQIHYQIWDLIIKLNPDINVSITTNGTVLNSKVKNFLEQLNASIIVSVDSLDRENFESIRVNAKFDQVMENLNYFMEYTKRKGTVLSFAVCPMQQNWKEIPSLLEFCNERDIDICFNIVLTPEKGTLRTLWKDEIFEIIKYLKEIDLTGDTVIQKSNNFKYRSLLSQIQQYYDNSFEFDEYSILKDIFEHKYKFSEYDQINILINDAIFEILKRISYQRGIEFNWYDKAVLKIETPFFDNPYIFFANKEISQRLKTIYQNVEIQRFIKVYFNILKTVFSVLHAREKNLSIDNLHEKLDIVCTVVLSHPGKQIIMKDYIEADQIPVLKQINVLSLEQLIQNLHLKYGYELLEHLKTASNTDDPEISEKDRLADLAHLKQIQKYYDNSFEYDEYNVLKDIFEYRYELKKQDEITKKINCSIKEILKRVADQKGVELNWYDNETLDVQDYFYDRPNIIIVNAKIFQSLKSIFQNVDNKRFIKEYCSILKTIYSVLHVREKNLAVDRLHKKLDNICAVVLSHSEIQLISKDLIGADQVSVLKQINVLSPEQLIQTFHAIYGYG